jgi:nicotinamidase/pyrazinamidase
MNKLLLVVDPQIDFISGSLAIEGAAQVMEALANYIRQSDGQYIYKVVTTDWHPYSHCSFNEQGGIWPQHCVQNSIGAAIYPSLIAPLNTTKGPLKVLRKGDNEKKEEYSVFANQSSLGHIQLIVKLKEIDQIDICGIAGDYCVLETLKDGIKMFGKDKWNVLLPYCASIDGGAMLNNFIKKEFINHFI